MTDCQYQYRQSDGSESLIDKCTPTCRKTILPLARESSRHRLENWAEEIVSHADSAFRKTRNTSVPHGKTLPLDSTPQAYGIAVDSDRNEFPMHDLKHLI